MAQSVEMEGRVKLNIVDVTVASSRGRFQKFHVVWYCSFPRSGSVMRCGTLMPNCLAIQADARTHTKQNLHCFLNTKSQDAQSASNFQR